MHSLSGALRLLSPTHMLDQEQSEADTVTTCPETEDTCPYCHVGYDRVTPLPHDRRRSSGYYGQQHLGSDHAPYRDNSPRTKAIIREKYFWFKFQFRVWEYYEADTKVIKSIVICQGVWRRLVNCASRDQSTSETNQNLRSTLSDSPRMTSWLSQETFAFHQAKIFGIHIDVKYFDVFMRLTLWLVCWKNVAKIKTSWRYLALFQRQFSASNTEDHSGRSS